MRAAILISLALLLPSAAHAAGTASPETWAPLRVFVGSWSGLRSAGEGADKVKREYQPVAGNQQLLITERVGGRSHVWGVVAFDLERQALVLRQSGGMDGETVLQLDPNASTEDRLVCTGADHPGRTRVSYGRLGWDEFVERVEYAPAGQEFAVASEARFRRRS